MTNFRNRYIMSTAKKFWAKKFRGLKSFEFPGILVAEFLGDIFVLL